MVKDLKASIFSLLRCISSSDPGFRDSISS